MQLTSSSSPLSFFRFFVEGPASLAELCIQSRLFYQGQDVSRLAMSAFLQVLKANRSMLC